MTVKKLIEELQKMPKNAQVIYDGSEYDGPALIVRKVIGVRKMYLDKGKSPVLIYWYKIPHRYCHAESKKYGNKIK
jgi:hypothetical protein